MSIASLKDAVLRDMAGTLNNAQLKRLELSAKENSPLIQNEIFLTCLFCWHSCWH